ncbi:MAG TPA: type IV toxin-antitoxin system AbiEi family antitoxin domain-containing protein [Solirubrobacterales bacterium]|nr:type IV toxin-antitoxin system AbiEi family antitoxin domain-containing protein [Solirubrobacterales bacterium]
MGHKSDTVDSRIADIAARQHGVITLPQLEDAGVTREAACKRAKRGRLHRLHRGVYAVGHSAPSHHRRWMAAVLACGDGAVLSHHSAAALWELLRPIDGPIHVSVPTTSGLKQRRGIHLHRCPALAGPPSSPPSPAIRGGRGRGTITTRRHNIPTTTIQRTIDDLEDTIAPYLLRRAKRQAEHKGVHLEGVESNRLRSDLEQAFLALFLEHRFPHPETNIKLGRHEVDFLWRERRLVVEADSFLYHRGSISFESDYARDLDLRQRGFTVLRFTDSQIEEEPGRVVDDVARALADGASGLSAQ